MEEQKIQALHDTLAKLKKTAGLGTASHYNFGKIKTKEVNGQTVREDGLPSNPLYFHFVKEGTYDPSTADAKKYGDGRAIKRNFEDSKGLEDGCGISGEDKKSKKKRKQDAKEKKKAEKKAAKLEAKKQAKLEEKRRAKLEAKKLDNTKNEDAEEKDEQKSKKKSKDEKKRKCEKESKEEDGDSSSSTASSEVPAKKKSKQDDVAAPASESKKKKKSKKKDKKQ